MTRTPYAVKRIDCILAEMGVSGPARSLQVVANALMTLGHSVPPDWPCSDEHPGPIMGGPVIALCNAVNYEPGITKGVLLRYGRALAEQVRTSENASQTGVTLTKAQADEIRLLLLWLSWVHEDDTPQMARRAHSAYERLLREQV